ncbi:MAG: Hsp33 family molecular chaperone HslO [Methylococcales bacterium]
MIEQDQLRRFLFENLGVRGEWVNLTQSWQAAKRHQTGSAVVQQQLGQALAAVVMLSATIKFKGSMILQAQGDGSIKTLVAQATDDLKIRGLVRSTSDVNTGTLEQLFGQGRLVLTIGAQSGAPYQGVVPLQGDNLAVALQSYFQQSEQLKTRIWLFADETQAAGLLLQELPEQKGYEADWERIVMLADTVTVQELFNLDCEQMLYRLFNEEQVRVFPAEAIEFCCSCSRAKIETTLRALGKVELEEILQEQGRIEVSCEFCSQSYVFDGIDVQSLLLHDSVIIDSETRH